MNQKFFLLAILGLLVLGFIYFPYFITSETKIVPVVNFSEEIQKSVAEIYVPAVNEKGEGVATILRVEAIPGEGRVLVDIHQLLFWVDTQYSIQIAKSVAQKLTGLNLSKIDLIYSIETNASIIEGPSAGAALTIATIAALENKSLNESVIITGTINPDGSIGPVGGILAKAQAGKQVGAKLFLVPKGQGTQVTYKPIRKCEEIGPITYCTIKYLPEKISISKDVGIDVIEVSNIEDALKYFLVE